MNFDKYILIVILVMYFDVLIACLSWDILPIMQLAPKVIVHMKEGRPRVCNTLCILLHNRI